MWHDVEQNSDEWFQMRAGKVTGSAIGKIMANYGKAFGEPAKKLAVDIAVHQLTGRVSQNNYSNAHMERGHEQEPIARQLYEDETFCDVTNGGFFDNGFTGCSPDGLVGDDGVIEIKSVVASQQFERVRKQHFDPAYKWQIVFNLHETSSLWLDYISYCADFPEGKQLYIQRVTPGMFANELSMMADRLREFSGLVSEAKNTIMEAA